MKATSLQRYPRESVDVLLSSVPFYKTVKHMDQYQYDLLLRHSKIIEFRPGEVIVEKGERDEWLYFLLKGQLEVRSGETAAVVNYITPGEVFGDLAILFDQVRTATVVADANSKKISVFATHFDVFGPLEAFHPISLATKLVYYRNMVHNLRWKLEVYRATHPEQKFASAHRKIKLYLGPKDCVQELRSLDQQARQLADLLVMWNNEIERLSLVPRSVIDSKSISAMS